MATRPPSPSARLLLLVAAIVNTIPHSPTTVRAGSCVLAAGTQTAKILALILQLRRSLDLPPCRLLCSTRVTAKTTTQQQRHWKDCSAAKQRQPTTVNDSLRRIACPLKGLTRHKTAMAQLIDQRNNNTSRGTIKQTTINQIEHLLKVWGEVKNRDGLGNRIAFRHNNIFFSKTIKQATINQRRCQLPQGKMI